MRKMFQHRNSGAEYTVRQIEDRPGEVRVEGYAVKWDDVAELWWWTESFRQGAFADVIGDEADIRFLLSHRGLAIARTTNRTLEFWEDETGLGLRATLNVEQDPDAQRAAAKIERRDVTGLSVGFSMNGGEVLTSWDEEGNEHDTIIKVGEFFETSLVTFPAYEESEVEVEREARMRHRYRGMGPEADRRAERRREEAREREAAERARREEARRALAAEIEKGQDGIAARRAAA